MEQRTKIKNFYDLTAWQSGHRITLEIYRLTKLFPKEELFGIVMQMRRAAVSVTSNIAEGFSRKSYKEKIQFFYLSLGSLTELQNQLIISQDLSYLNKADFEDIFNKTVNTQKIINGLIRSSKTFLNS